MERDDSTEKEEDLEDDQQALLNLERNIANIERSMSASQLEKANYKGRRREVNGNLSSKESLYCTLFTEYTKLKIELFLVSSVL